MKWYSVKKYSPLKGAVYIITDGDFAYMALYSTSGEWVDEANGYVIGRVTHFCFPDPIEIEEE